MPEIRFARSVGDIDIAYSEFGRRDGPRLVWVSGFISHLEMNWEAPPYANLIAPLAEACRVIAFDKRGTGLSSRDIGFGSLADRTDDIRAVMDACGWPDAHLFGMSEGGPLALLFAATYPERVSSFSLYGTGARFSRARDYPRGPGTDDVESVLAFLEQNWGTGLCLGHPFVAHADEGPIADIARFERNACTPKMAAEICRRNLEIDVRSLLPTLHVPTLVDSRSRSTRAGTPRTTNSSSTPWSTTCTGSGSGLRASACWPRCCSPTSSTRRKRRPGSVISNGAGCSTATTRSHSVVSTTSEAGW